MATAGASGSFIVIEGIDGSGSSTQASALVDWLRGIGRTAMLTAEPTTGPVGVLLRQILSKRVVGSRPGNSSTHPVHPDVIALLFAADRMDHLDCYIDPLIQNGIDVISDRYYHSSFLYQSLSSDESWVRTINSHARTPDVTYVLNVSAKVARQRRSLRASEELFETEPMQTALADSYAKLPQLLPTESIIVLDGSKSADEIHRQIVSDLCKRFGWSDEPV